MASKRKRANPPKSSSQTTPSESHQDNPYNYDDATLSQLAVAGLSPSDPLPSWSNPLFPHAPIRPTPLQRRSLNEDNDDDEDEDEGETGDDKKDGRRKKKTTTTSMSEADLLARDYDATIGPVLAAVHRFLGEGDLPRARWAFGLIVRARLPNGSDVDLRYDGLWELGAKILVACYRRSASSSRASSSSSSSPPDNRPLPNKPDEGDDGNDRDSGSREKAWAWAWGGNSAEGPLEARENLRTYFADLANMYPYDKDAPPDALSSLDFLPGVFRVEFEGAYDDYHAELDPLVERWRTGELTFDELEDVLDDQRHFEGEEEDDKENNPEGRFVRAEEEDRGNRADELFRRAKDRLRVAALARIHEVADKMDDVMEAPPFSTDHELCRTRALVALYTADLCVPRAPESEADRAQGMEARERERDRAKRLFRQILDGGGRLQRGDGWVRRWLEGGEYGEGVDGESGSEDDEDSEVGEEEEEEEEEGYGSGGDEPVALPMFSSMN
ncbi:hypothetical protein QBC47DRAFT_413527 [Echria macrotheca]|uniref:Uncharacterized protein n=1 Tax=Echria macrotheca TaxID=438768 RepID=A0AAJ0FC36_9PEZI|nr:hypothetical protein QBC47DRAFT_413527 [Echria macrotheca]